MAPVAAELQDRVGVGQGVDHLADVVDPQSVLGHQVAQQPLVGALPVGERTLEVRQVLPGHPHRLGLVRHRDVDHTVGNLHRHRPDLFRTEDPESAALDHGRSADPDVGALGGDDHVAAAEQHRVAGEAAAIGHTNQGHESAEPGKVVEGQHVETGHAESDGVPGSSTSALGEQHEGQPVPLGDFEQPVLLEVVQRPLGPGEHGVVVGHHDAAGTRVIEDIAVDPADAGDHPVGRGITDQVLL